MTADAETPIREFDKSQAKTAVKALLEYVSKKKDGGLFMDAPTRFLLDISAFKTPSGSHQYYNIILPNTPYPDALESLDILLVVRDVKGLEPERVIGEVKDELRASSARDKLKVRQIMTLKQLKDDYSTHEAKRALSKTVDLVIAEQNLFKMMPKLLGREFQKKKKFHLGIPGREFKDHDLGEQIFYALKKTVLHISLKGQTSTVVAGFDNLNAEELACNIEKIAHWLKKKFPGGWKNIQKLAIHNGEGGMPPLVIHFSTGSSNDVKKPPITKGGSIPNPIDGDLSTQPGSRIKVHPTGRIEVLEEKEVSQEDQELIRELADKPIHDKRNNKKGKKNLKKEVKKEEVKGEESDNDDEEMEDDEEDKKEEEEDEGIDEDEAMSEVDEDESVEEDD